MNRPTDIAGNTTDEPSPRETVKALVVAAQNGRAAAEVTEEILATLRRPAGTAIVDLKVKLDTAEVVQQLRDFADHIEGTS